MAMGQPSPVLMVHGAEVTPPSGVDCATTWDDLKRFLRDQGFADRPLLTISYYEQDANCDRSINDATGSHGQSYFDAYGTHSGGAGGHTANANIEHIAYHLAWFIYDNYSTFDAPVDIVAHSMGGLITRYALGEVDAENPAFPPTLLIDDAITLATPHGGARPAPLLWCAAFRPNRQCSQMRAGSSLLRTLEARAWNPQGAQGTDWTALGSDADQNVAADRAVGTSADRSRNMYFGACHKVAYPAARFEQRTFTVLGIQFTRNVIVPQPIGHDGFMHDGMIAGGSGATDLLSHNARPNCGAPLREDRSQPHPMAEIVRALESHDSLSALLDGDFSPH